MIENCNFFFFFASPDASAFNSINKFKSSITFSLLHFISQQNKKQKNMPHFHLFNTTWKFKNQLSCTYFSKKIYDFIYNQKEKGGRALKHHWPVVWLGQEALWWARSSYTEKPIELISGLRYYKVLFFEKQSWYTKFIH